MDVDDIPILFFCENCAKGLDLSTSGVSHVKSMCPCEERDIVALL